MGVGCWGAVGERRVLVAKRWCLCAEVCQSELVEGVCFVYLYYVLWESNGMWEI